MSQQVSFPELTVYAQNINDLNLVKRIETFLKDADVSNTKGRERLILVCSNFKKLTFDQAYRLLDPDAFRDEFEDAQSYKRAIKMLNYARIILSLAPLILTWLALFFATTGYQQDLQKYPGDSTEAFLQLWQEGFRHTTAFTFSTTALIDVLLLLGFLATTFRALYLEYRARAEAKAFAKQLRLITDTLLSAVNAEGISPITSQADIDKVVKAVRNTLSTVFDELEVLIKDSRVVVLQANNRVEQLFTSHIDPMLTRFDQNISAFQGNINKLTQEVTQVATASNAMALASTSMATSSVTMSGSSTDLNQNVAQINTHLISLNETEKKIDASQKSLTNEFGRGKVQLSKDVQNATVGMSNAATEVKTAANRIAVVNPQDVQQMYNNATILSNKTKETAIQLQNVINLLNANGMTRSPKRSTIKIGSFNIPNPFKP